MPFFEQTLSSANMPSFYPTYLPSHLTYPISDYEAAHSLQSQYRGAQEPASAYSSRHHPTAKDVNHVHPNPYDMYNGAPGRGGINYGQHHGYGNTANFQPASAPMLPPGRINEYSLQQTGYKKSSRVDQLPSYANQRREEEKVVGGVSAKLDYDMEQMTDFVVEMTLGVINPPTYKLDTFRSWVLQVLNATRLPSATILLSMSYMTLRVRRLTASRSFSPSEYGLYEFLTVALILGSKFLDDNTFQNKSWAEVSNIKVDVLNKEELHWLASFDHRLHHDPHCADGFSNWENRWNAHKAQVASAAASANLLPLDTGVRRQGSRRNAPSPSHYHPQYPVSAMSSISLEADVNQGQFSTPTYSPYNPWFHQRSTAERSPSTAPHTGPSTPDYYSGHGGWGPIDPNAARNRPYGYSTVPHFTSSLETYPPPYEPPAYNYSAGNVWNCHGAACQCASCRQTHMPRYGPIVVG